MITTSASNATANFWEQLLEYLHWAVRLFGQPEDIAQQVWLTKVEHKQVCDFLRPLEDMIRRLIFVAALQLAPMTPPQRPERKFRERLGMPTSNGAHFDPAQPDSWRVSLNLNPVLTIGVTAGKASSAAPKPVGESARTSSNGRISSAACAKRLEALVRAYNNREKLAAALARKLAHKPQDAFLFGATIPKKHRGRGAYIALEQLVEHVRDTHQRHIHAQLDALLPDSS